MSLFRTVSRMGLRGGSLWYSSNIATVNDAAFRWGRSGACGSNATTLRLVRRILP